MKPVHKLLEEVDVHGIAHITGGGFDENIPRIFPNGQGAVINEGTWEIPGVFRLIEKYGNIPHREMFNIFNMGVGMVIAVDPEDAEKALEVLRAAGEKPVVIGRVADVAGIDIILLDEDKK